MNREETDHEARATKNIGNVWKWILGVGIVLSLVAWLGGFFNHDERFRQSETPSESAAGVADSSASDTIMELHTDSTMEHVRGTE
ncbi:hypothetical protein HWI92_14870 [Dyadobacter sandarakinus]|uniref:Uncharacterized protein n=2 Tax=Dyadobacter sandarakinus TaxID=2747268 RepID=A0ABX7IEF8_9BACT|nr:hypothetical protein HWI92_14870 [Dyadobacter sandarakinus]